VNAKAAECLINAGALDCISPNRASLQQKYKLYSEQAKKGRGRIMEGQGSFLDEIRGDIYKEENEDWTPDFDSITKSKLEKEVLGVYVSGHPLDSYQQIIDRIVNISSGTLNDPKEYHQSGNTDVIIVGQITEIKRIITRKGESMAVMMLEDLEGLIKVLVVPKAMAKYDDILQTDEIVVVRGKVNLDYFNDTVTASVVARKITPIDEVELFFQNQGAEEDD
jgi:DNA polymerase-3 subunit alpha